MGYTRIVQIAVMVSFLAASYGCEDTFEKISDDPTFEGADSISDRFDGTYEVIWKPLSLTNKVILYAVYKRHQDAEYDFTSPVSTTKSASYITQNLSLDPRYCYVVRASVDGEVDSNQKEVCVRGEDMKPFEGIVSLEFLEDGSYLIIWESTKSTGLAFEVFQREKDEVFKWNKPIVRTRGSEYQTQSNFNIGEQICFAVRAVDADSLERIDQNTNEICGNGLDSAGGSEFLGIRKVEKVSKASVKVIWADPPGNAEVKSFVVYNDANFTKPIAVAESSDRSVIVDNLTPGSVHYFGVRYKNKYDLEDFNQTTLRYLVADDRAPEFSGVVSASFVGPDKVSVTWIGAESAVDKYKVYFGSRPRDSSIDNTICENPVYIDTCSSIVDWNNSATTVSGDALTAILTIPSHPTHGAPDDYAYFIGVRALGVNGIEDQNKVVRKVNSEDKGPPIFSGIESAERIGNNIKLTWGNPVGEVSTFRISITRTSDNKFLYEKSSLINKSPLPYIETNASVSGSIMSSALVEYTDVVVDENSDLLFSIPEDSIGFQSGYSYRIQVNARDRRGNLDSNVAQQYVSFLDTVPPSASIRVSPGFKIAIEPTDNSTSTESLVVQVFKKASDSPTDFPQSSDAPILTNTGIVTVLDSCASTTKKFINFRINVTDGSGNMKSIDRAVKCFEEAPPGYVKIGKDYSGLSYDFYIMSTEAKVTGAVNNTVAVGDSCFEPSLNCLQSVYRYGFADSSSCGCDVNSHTTLKNFVASPALSIAPTSIDYEAAWAACLNASTDDYLMRLPSLEEMMAAVKWQGGDINSYRYALNNCQAEGGDYDSTAFPACTSPLGVKMFSGGKAEHLGNHLFQDFPLQNTTFSTIDMIHHNPFDFDHISYDFTTNNHGYPSWYIPARAQMTDNLASNRSVRCIATLRASSPDHDKLALPFDPLFKGLSVEKKATETVVSWNPKIKHLCADANCTTFQTTDAMEYRLYRFESGKMMLESIGTLPPWVEPDAHYPNGGPIDALATDSSGVPLYDEFSSGGKFVGSVTGCGEGTPGDCSFTDSPAGGTGYVAGSNYFYVLLTVDPQGNKVQDIYTGDLYTFDYWDGAGEVNIETFDGTPFVESSGAYYEGRTSRFGSMYSTDRNGYIWSRWENRHYLYRYNPDHTNKYSNPPSGFTYFSGSKDSLNDFPAVYVGPTPTPGFRVDATWVADTLDGSILLFGGIVNNVGLADLWSFRPSDGTWTLLYGDGNETVMGVTHNCTDQIPSTKVGSGWIDHEGNLLIGRALAVPCHKNSVYWWGRGVWKFTFVDPLNTSLGGSWSKVSDLGPFHFIPDSPYAMSYDRKRVYAMAIRSNRLYQFDNETYQLTELFGDPGEDNIYPSWNGLKRFHPDNDPGVHNFGAMYLDSFDRLWLVGGRHKPPQYEGSRAQKGDVWVYDLSLGQWALFSGYPIGCEDGYYPCDVYPQKPVKKGAYLGNQMMQVHWVDSSTHIDFLRGSLWIRPREFGQATLGPFTGGKRNVDMWYRFRVEFPRSP